MYRKSKMFFMHQLTPSHLGVGEGLGVIDMPIQREKQTGYPKIEGSSLKGSIREVFREKANSYNAKKESDEFNRKINLTFGPEDNGDKHAGSLGFTDGKILLFPVKSVKGVYAWITSHEVLRRFVNDLKLVTGDENSDLDISGIQNPNNDETSSCITTSNTTLIIKDFVILEEYYFKTVPSKNCDKIADFIAGKIGMKNELENRLLILSDDDFKDFVNLSTEVITRTRIDPETGTVETGALFTEEYLPAETVMYSMVLASPVFLEEEKNSSDIKSEDAVMKFFTDNIPPVIQIGGNATLGKGLVKIMGLGGKK